VNACLGVSQALARETTRGNKACERAENYTSGFQTTLQHHLVTSQGPGLFCTTDTKSTLAEGQLGLCGVKQTVQGGNRGL
jgi:hypothetical protein